MGKQARVSKPKPAASDAKLFAAELEALRVRGLKGAALEEALAEPAYSVLTDMLFGRCAERIPTGSLALDKLTDGGWPVGRITELAGWEATGKTSCLDQSIAQNQRMGGIPVLIDSEQARDFDYSKVLGVDLTRVIGVDVATMEDVFLQLDRVIEAREKHIALAAKKKVTLPPQLVIWDSIGGTTTRTRLEKEAGEVSMTPEARLLADSFKRVLRPIGKDRIAFVCSNHFYTNIGPFGGLTSYGGKGIKYYTSLRLRFSKKDRIKLGDRIVGQEIEASIYKTRVGRQRPPVLLGMINGYGFDNAYTLYTWGLSNGVGEAYPEHRYVVNKGRYSYLVLPGRAESIRFEQQFLGLGEVLRADAAAYNEFAAIFRGPSEATP